MARSYIAGTTLRFARSPEAPKSTTVHGSVTLGAPFPVSFLSTSCLPPGSPVRFASFRDASTLYLNTAFLQFGSQLFGILIMNYIHAQAPRILQIERAVVDKNALRGRALRNF